MRSKELKISFKTVSTDPATTNCSLLAVGLFKDSEITKDKAIFGVDKLFGGVLKKSLDSGAFKADAGSTHIVCNTAKGGPDFLLMVGMGEKTGDLSSCIRDTAAKISSAAVGLKAKNIAIALPKGVLKKNTEALAKSISEGAFLGGFRFDKFQSDAKPVNNLSVSLILESGVDATSAKKGLKAGQAIGSAQSYARAIVNLPANVIYPESLAKEAQSLASKYANLKCTVLDDKKLMSKKMGGILAVGQGSAKPARMIVIEYTPTKKNAPKVALVGKAVTFDSGGISIKPSSGMEEMKLDKGGGIAVLGTMKAIAELKPAVRVTAIICAAENMPGANSYRPGDIISTYSGKTIEIINTDAEGRLCLADGLWFAKELMPDVILDAATLTGACVVALGENYAGVFTKDDKLAACLDGASSSSGEKVWRMPLDEDFLSDMKSEVADLKNCGPRWGGASTAAAFLSEFVGDVSWAHIDIAGPAMKNSKKAYGCSGSSAFGVRLFSDFISNYTK